MPRTRSAEVAYRDEQIAKEAGEGISRRELAAKYGVTQARISQIILAHHEEISDEATRAEMVAHLFFVAQNLLEIQRRPRPPKVSASGKLIYEPLLDENGEPLRDNRGQFVPDPSKPVLDDSPIIESAKQIPGTYDRIAKLMGLDRKAPKEKDESAEYAAMISWAEGLANENRALRERVNALDAQEVFEAEVVPSAEIENSSEV